jgi:hypothetical protein
VRLVWGRVDEVLLDDDQIQTLVVSLEDGTSGPAIAYPHLSGRCAPGERVLLNTTAVDLALGTGGSHFVVARSVGQNGVILDAPSGGHIMKLRYTPMQVDVQSVEEQRSPYHETMQQAVDLGGMPVVCCGLHSHVPLVAAALRGVQPALTVAYVMTDEAALTMALSNIVREATEVGLLDSTITCGQSFGGEHEAVNLYSGLLAARHVAKADAAIVSIGPGVVGTATPFGHGGVAQGTAMNAAAALGGRPIAVLRLSFADQRPRHRGVSHHSLTALTGVALARVVVAVPRLLPEQAAVVDRALDEARVWERHSRVDAPGLRPDMRGMQVTTMGREEADDPAFFASAWAAGEVCGAFLVGQDG